MANFLSILSLLVVLGIIFTIISFTIEMVSSYYVFNETVQRTHSCVKYKVTFEQFLKEYKEIKDKDLIIPSDYSTLNRKDMYASNFSLSEYKVNMGDKLYVFDFNEYVKYNIWFISELDNFNTVVTDIRNQHK